MHDCEAEDVGFELESCRKSCRKNAVILFR